MALSASCRFSISVQPSKSNCHRRHHRLLNPYSANSPAYPNKSLPIHNLQFSNCRNLNTLHPPAASSEPLPCSDSEEFPLKLPPSNSFSRLLRLSASSSVFFIAACSFVLGFRGAHLPPPALALGVTAPQEQCEEGKVEEKQLIRATDLKSEEVALEFEDEESRAAFQAYKTKVFPLTVHLRLVALRASVPPSWIESFVRSQGKRLRFKPRFDASLEGIFSDLSVPFTQGTVKPKSAAAADVVSVADSWLSLAIKKSIIEPIEGVEDQEWFKGLSERWKIYLRRNREGEIDPEGKIWAAPYRWGSIVIAYKKSKLQKHNIAPIKDWADLWQPGLAGRISMINCPREVIGAILKHMGASYNTSDMQLEVTGGRDAVQENLASFRKQVRLFDSTHYLKAFGVGDVWVAVGWSSDVIPAAKRMSDVAVMVPKSGASLWADLWAIPAAPSKVNTEELGGRVRGPSPLIHQWIEFCLQPARALPFKQEVVPGASPTFLESYQVEVPKELVKGKPKMDTNLVAGVPPPEILANCEFLEPLSDAALSDYQWLLSSVNKPDLGLVHRMQNGVSSTFQTLCKKLPQKVIN